MREKIDKIYELVADKTLSFGCLFSDECRTDIIALGSHGYNQHPRPEVPTEIHGMYCQSSMNAANFEVGSIVLIKGHPVMIGDVLDYLYMESGIEVSGGDGCISGKIVSKRLETRKPIEEQPYECIEFIYSLVTEGQKKQSQE